MPTTAGYALASALGSAGSRPGTRFLGPSRWSVKQWCQWRLEPAGAACAAVLAADWSYSTRLTKERRSIVNAGRGDARCRRGSPQLFVAGASRRRPARWRRTPRHINPGGSGIPWPARKILTLPSPRRRRCRLIASSASSGTTSRSASCCLTNELQLPASSVRPDGLPSQLDAPRAGCAPISA